MKIKFITDFAGNWKAGDVVETESLPNNNTLVDNVACIDTALLMEHCEIVTENEEEVRELNFIQPKKTVGKLISIDVLDKIRTELHATVEIHEDGNYYLREKWIDEIFDKYKVEKEKV